MRKLNEAQIQAYAADLKARDRSAGTIEKYLRDVNAFASWLANRSVTRETAAEWRTHLLSKGYRPSTINSMLAALNSFFRFMGWTDCRASFQKIQRQLFCESSRELSRSDYERLLSAAHSLGRERLALLLETMCASTLALFGLFFEGVRNFI